MRKFKRFSIFLLVGILLFSLFFTACGTNTGNQSGSSDPASESSSTPDESSDVIQIKERTFISYKSAKIHPSPYHVDDKKFFYSIINNTSEMLNIFSINDYALGSTLLTNLYTEEFFKESALIYCWVHLRADAGYKFSTIYRENNQLIIQIDLHIEEYKTDYEQGVAWFMCEVNKQDIANCENVIYEIVWHYVEFGAMDD